MYIQGINFTFRKTQSVFKVHVLQSKQGKFGSILRYVHIDEKLNSLQNSLLALVINPGLQKGSVALNITSIQRNTQLSWFFLSPTCKKIADYNWHFRGATVKRISSK